MGRGPNLNNANARQDFWTLHLSQKPKVWIVMLYSFLQRLSYLLAALWIAAGAASAENALPVEVITAKRAPIERELRLTGTIEAVSTYSASFQTAGQLIRLEPQIGDTVLAGTSIGAIEVIQQTATRNANQAAVAGAKGVLTLVQKEFDRQSTLLRRGIVTASAVEAAEQSLVQAQSSLDQATARLAASNTALENAELFVPRDSIVTSRNAEPGQVVGAGQPIIGLASMTERNVVFLTPDGSNPERFLGSIANVRFLDRRANDVTATIYQVSPVVTADTGSIKVKARIVSSADTSDTIPMLGETVEGSVTVQEPPAFVLPWEAIASDKDGMAVWTVDRDTMKAILTPVEVQRFTSTTVIVSGGIEEGTLVVGKGSQLLYADRLVRDVAGTAE
jgi:RND family efflux transporter MFP subunit